MVARTTTDEGGLCFVIMPFSASEAAGYEQDHFLDVFEDLFAPAIRRSTFVS